MIGRIRGVLLEASPPHLLLEVGGVGYEIETPLSTFERLPKLQSEVRLYTHVAIREDTQLLFGFLTETERRLFRALIKVNGVGARTALGVLSGTSPEEFAVWVETKDLTRLTRLPGIGRRPPSASSSSCTIGSPIGGAACFWAARHRPAMRSATGTI